MLAKLRSELRNPSPAFVLAALALFVALGGSSYAAVTLKKNSVKGRHIAKNAVTAPKVKDQSLLAQDFAPGELQAGPKGERGEKGEQGETGGRGPAGKNTRMFTGNGAFEVPEGVVGVVAELRGGGGGGAFLNAWSGGGQGAFVRAWIPVDQGQTLDVTVGGGGFGELPGFPFTGPGGDSSVKRGSDTLVTAAGGQGGGSGTAGGGQATVGAGATGVATEQGQASQPSNNNNSPSPGGGPPGYFGSGGRSGGGFGGAAGYVLLYLVDS